MKNKENRINGDLPGAGQGKSKKAYQKPSVASEVIYEKNALACGKTPSQRTFRCRVFARIS
ncbi:MAG: hypothetical protein HZA48_04030 [Planctomycetes bacterium]|nr:hypothetical protein [Planctomycetota bacterium]